MRHAWVFALVLAMGLMASPVVGESVVPDGAEPTRLGQGYGWAEGPAVGPNGAVYFTDVRESRIHRYEPGSDSLTVYRKDTGGGNGLAFDEQGRLYVCEGDRRRVTRSQPGAEKVEVLAARYEGNRLNSPNDLVIDEAGGVYFTDPRYGDRQDMEMEVEGVYYWHPDEGLRRVIDELARPNGLGLSPDNETLYVNDNAAGTIVAYDVTGPGELSDKRLFATMPEKRGGDGMAIDRQGRLFNCSEGGVYVFNQDGELIDRIELEMFTTNCVLAGDKHKQTRLYITGEAGFYVAPVNAQPQ